MSEAWVMCGGPSHKQTVSVPYGDKIIAVNKDVFRYTNADYFITMDNRFASWELIGKDLPQGPTKIFVANMADPNLRCGNSFADKRWGISYDLSHYDMIIKSYGVDGFGFRWNDFRNGGNSGYCAIQLAMILGFKTIHLVGMDLCISNGQTHHHGGYAKCKDDYVARFDEFATRISRALVNELSYHSDIKIINHSPISILKDVIGYEPI
jgi:hypothetical protein